MRAPCSSLLHTSCLSNVLPQILNRTLVVPHLIWPRASDIQDQSLDDLTHFGDESCAFCILSSFFAVDEAVCIYRTCVWSAWNIQNFPHYQGVFISSLLITFSLKVMSVHLQNWARCPFELLYVQMMQGSYTNLKEFHPHRLVVMPRKPTQDVLQVVSWNCKPK